MPLKVIKKTLVLITGIKQNIFEIILAGFNCYHLVKINYKYFIMLLKKIRNILLKILISRKILFEASQKMFPILRELLLENQNWYGKRLMKILWTFDRNVKQ